MSVLSLRRSPALRCSVLDVQDLLNQEIPSGLVAPLQDDRSGNQQETIHQYEAVVRAGGATGIATDNVGWLYALKGKNLDRASQLAKHAWELNPSSPQVLDTLRIIELENRQFTGAIGFSERGIRRAAHSPEMAALTHDRGTLGGNSQLAGQPAALP